MAAVDIGLCVVLLASVLLGAWRGLVFEVLSVAGWVVAFFVAQWYAADAGQWLPMQSASEPLRYAAGYALVFVAVAFACGLLTWAIKHLIEAVGLRPVDRVLGAAFGFLRALVLLLALTLLVGLTPMQGSEAWQASIGADWLTTGLHVLKPLAPGGLAPYFL